VGVPTANLKRLTASANRLILATDERFCRLIWCALIGIFRPRAALQAEILVLRHQLNVLRRKSPKRLAFDNVDRLVFTALYRVAPGVLDALKILKPQTVVRGTALGSELTDAGNHDRAAAGQRQRRTFASSFVT
jgi:hypothetical protein